ncbi:MAG: PEP-CTERM sorting domain-containing protein [Fimbriimonadales bacterium]|nr:PEP-CTERM sorting domain-containing protein [Fimbriimonadales bacterium]
MKPWWVAATAGLPVVALAGPYASNGVLASEVTHWATSVAELQRGYQNIANPSLGYASFGVASNGLGHRDGSLVSLGDGGWITLHLAKGISNGPGWDFAVWENGFLLAGSSRVFAELAFVEVSSNGTDFFRFPSVSLTQTTTQVGSFAGIDPTDIHNLAGQFVAQEGSPFDLEDLASVSPLLDVNRIHWVRLIDVVGSLDPQYARYDSLGNRINDPWPTPFQSSGFDLDAVGARYQAVPEPATAAALLLGLGAALRRRRA